MSNEPYHPTDFTGDQRNVRRDTSDAGRAALSHVAIGVDRSPHAQPHAAHAPRLAVHEFRPTADGRMEHHIDGNLRATVAPEGLDDYAEAWPDCKLVARLLKRADR